MITLTENATAKIQEIFAEENNPALKLRVFVQGGGCSGMQYGFTFDEEVNEDDWNMEFGGVNVLIDSMSGQYLQGATIDFKDDLMGASFSINNPNAQTTCGCGSSFSPG
jgi:iron-sulfur cluster insertion protein